MLTGIACLLVIALVVTYPLVPWPRLFNVTTEAAKHDSGRVAAVLIVCVAAAMPLGVVQRVQLGYQEGFLNDVWQGAGSLLALAGLLAVVSLRCGLPWLVLAVAGGPLLASGGNWVNQFGFRRRWLTPRRAHFDWGASKRLLQTGILFLVLQIECLLTYSSDNLIVAQLFESSTVAQYAITQKVFSAVLMAQGCWLGPLWPAYGEALARGDIAWIRRTLLRSIAVSALFAGAASTMVLVFGHILFAVWVHGRVPADFGLMVACAVWTVLQSVGSATAMFWNGTNVLKFQAVTGGVTTVLAFPLRIILGRQFGLAGVVWGASLAYLVAIVIPTAIYLPRKVRANRSTIPNYSQPAEVLNDT